MDIFKAIPVGPGRTKDGNCTMAQVYPIKKGSQELWIKNKKREVFSRTKQALLPPTPARLVGYLSIRGWVYRVPKDSGLRAAFFVSRVKDWNSWMENLPQYNVSYYAQWGLPLLYQRGFPLAHDQLSFQTVSPFIFLRPRKGFLLLVKRVFLGSSIVTALLRRQRREVFWCPHDLYTLRIK